MNTQSQVISTQRCISHHASLHADKAWLSDDIISGLAKAATTIFSPVVQKVRQVFEALCLIRIFHVLPLSPAIPYGAWIPARLL
jgi:hypothetical protein